MALTPNPPPPTPCGRVTEILHGVPVTDPYRWLEDQESRQTREWIAAQHAYCRNYFASAPVREVIRQRVSELLSIVSVAEIWNVGDRYFFLKGYEGKEQPVIVMRNGLFAEDTILVDLASRPNGPSTAVAIASIS